MRVHGVWHLVWPVVCVHSMCVAHVDYTIHAYMHMHMPYQAHAHAHAISGACIAHALPMQGVPGWPQIYDLTLTPNP